MFNKKTSSIKILKNSMIIKLLNKASFLKDERGDSIVFFTLTFILVLGMAGAVIDGGILYSTKIHLKKTANAAALSGAQELTSSSESAAIVANEVLKAHGEEQSLQNLAINPEGKYKISVTLEKEVSMYFMKLFKINSVKVKETSSAELKPMKRAEGAVPLGIDESIPLEYMKEYRLKVDSGDSNYGNFGILALSGPGAMLYEQDLRYGYEGELKVGDVIDTQTGNVEGKTRNSINARISACHYGEDEFSHRDCPRVILILVYRPYNVTSNQMKQVKITGFAYFYIKDPVDSHDSSITGYFIKRAGTGYGDDEIKNNGAYAIRLTE